MSPNRPSERGRFALSLGWGAVMFAVGSCLLLVGTPPALTFAVLALVALLAMLACAAFRG